LPAFLGHGEACDSGQTFLGFRFLLLCRNNEIGVERLEQLAGPLLDQEIGLAGGCRRFELVELEPEILEPEILLGESRRRSSRPNG